MDIQPVKIVLDLNAPVDRWNLKSVERIPLMKKDVDNWPVYDLCGADYPQVNMRDFGKPDYSVFYETF